MLDKEFPVLYGEKEECCGCTACYAICPRGAISMIEDEEGFEYPKIDESKCIRCYKCLTVCPFKKAKEKRRQIKQDRCKDKQAGGSSRCN